jgi:hypothetical protein
MLYAQAIETHLTALYVMESPEARFPGMLRGIRLARTGQQIVDEIAHPFAPGRPKSMISQLDG